MQKIILKAPAKINWTLGILGKRSDGYHDISTIMQSVAIYDEIIMERSTEPILSVSVDTGEVPGGMHNIAYRAAKLMLDTFKIDGGINIYIHKNIPIAAGMGGGSSDGAAVMLGIEHMYDIDVSREKLIHMGKDVGADIPFCLFGGTALAEGIGEKLTPLPPIDTVWLVIVKPNFNISTGEIYGLVDMEQRYRQPDNKAFIQALHDGDLDRMSCHGGNVLEEISAKLYPRIYDIKADLLEAGAIYALMSGSGPSVFGVFRSEREAQWAHNKLKDKYGQVFVTHTIDTGPRVLEV